ncbi:MAG: nucleoside hydrolase [Planctomycetota bacterium]
MRVRLPSPCSFSLALLITFSFACSAEAQKPKLILDADTANEIDDMYAITRMLKQDKFEVLALTSAQWVHYLAEEDSVGASQRENESLLELLDRTDLPAPQGSSEPMGKPWGGDEAKDSAAAQFIIKAARQASPEKKLTVVSLGASTNLASAIRMAPEIAENIDAYLLGFRYDLEKDVWNKSSFNVRRDLNAADYLLNCEALELHVMPANVARALTFERDPTFERHERMGALGEHLTAKWKARFAEFNTWVMWDLALVQAILDPTMAEQRQVDTPPENVARKVWLYDSVNESRMQKDYWETVLGKEGVSSTTRFSSMTYEELLAEFEPYPNKVDMLVVVAHPDDEGYLGGLLTHYTLGLKKSVAVVCLTSGEWGSGLPHHTNSDQEPDYSHDDSDYPRYVKVPVDATYPCYFREEEMSRALLTYGVRLKPVMPRFKDMSGLEPWGVPEPCFEYWGGRDKVVGFVVSQIRRFCPEVVVTLAVDGANGNPQHCAASRSAVLASDAAGDARFFPEQLERYKHWTVKKLYLHVSEEELSKRKYATLHRHDWELICNAEGESARTIAAMANAQHGSQEMKNECDEVTQFTLAISRVGPDRIGVNDLFENLALGR